MRNLDPSDVPVRFGALPPLPPGHLVIWSEGTEHYHALGPDEWESDITCNRFQARRWCFAHADAITGRKETT